MPGGSPTFTELIIPYLAGSLSGGAESFFAHPIDTVKTRIQSRVVSGEALKSHERYWPKLNTVSGIRALYDGLSPAVLRGLFAGALFMGTNDSFKRLFAGGTEESRNPLAPSFILAGAATGLVEAMVYCPFETAKVQLQVGNYQTTRGCFRALLNHSGLPGIYLGFGGLLGKTVLGNVAFFTSYAALCNWMEPAGTDGEPKPPPSTTTTLVAGGIANMLYYAAGHPMDTVQSITMAQRYPREVYKSWWDCIKIVTKQHGWRALFRGLAPNVLQAAPGGAACMVTYEVAMAALDPNNPENMW